MAAAKHPPPSGSGTTSTTTPATKMSWTLEDPETHWAEHDVRERAYWLSRPPAERLAQAAEYRYRQHGDLPEPTVWTWRLLPPYKR